MESLKENAEIRHTLAHMIYAIRALTDGYDHEAKYELDQIEALVFWEDDKHMTNHIEGVKYGEEKLQQKTEKLQRKVKKLQGKKEIEG